MSAINVSDRVRIVSAKSPKEQAWVNKVGVVVMIADGTRCVVAFPDQSAATVEIDQLVKAG
jgi:hypothetical protein